VLEELYGIFYEELEHHANPQQRYPTPPGPEPFLRNVELDKSGAIVAHTPQARGAKPPTTVLRPPVTNGRKQQQCIQPHPLNDPPLGKEIEFEDDKQEDEDYDGKDYEEEEEEVPEEEEEEEVQVQVQQPQRRTPKTTPVARRAPQQVPPRRIMPTKGRDGLFNIGNTLSVAGQLKQSLLFQMCSNSKFSGPGNLSVVADYLLKNDGQKFQEMVEQLAEQLIQHKNEGRDWSEGDVGGNDEGGDSDEDDYDEGGGEV